MNDQDQIIKDLQQYEIKVSDPIKLKDDHSIIMLDFIKEFGRVPDKISIERYKNENNKIFFKVYFKKYKEVKE